MLFKIAHKNIRKSIKDYFIYFLTLTFGVCIFYMFNSIKAQEIMLIVTEIQHESIEALSILMGYTSILIAVILGFLIVYANNFLIKRRKKELGIYMTLGMEKKHISKILMFETLSVAIVSLISGLFSGVLLSQLMSIFTAKIFEVDMSGFRFIFSLEATIKSSIYFGIIFLIVMIFNQIVIAKYKIIDLIYAGKKNEKLKMKSIKLSILIFILSILAIGSAYYLFITNGLLELGFIFAITIVLGTLGTLLFFMSLSGFLIQLLQRNKKMYFKDLNVFVLRQLNNKINTNFISMTIVSLMLLIVIGTFSTGLTMSSFLSKDLKEITPYDISLYNNYYGDEYEGSIKEGLEKDINLSKYAEAIDEYNIYNTELRLKDIFGQKNSDLGYLSSGQPVSFMSVRDYNEIALNQSAKKISLLENEYLLTSNVDSIKPTLLETINLKKGINIDGNMMYPKEDLVHISLDTAYFQSNLVTIIIPNQYTYNMDASSSVLNINYKSEALGETFEKLLIEYTKEKNMANEDYSFDYFLSKAQLYNQGITTKALISFLVIYLGFVFLITCAATLSLQQLSEASDNRERYKILKNIGVDSKMINRSIFRQILIYFIAPLSLAIIHAYVGIKVVNETMVMLGSDNMFYNILITAGFIIVIYGAYFIATYMSSKNIINKED